MKKQWINIEADMELAYTIGRRLCRKHPTLFDLDVRSITNLALVDAKVSYKKKFGKSFNNWLAIVVKRYLIEEFRNRPTVIRKKLESKYEIFENEEFEEWQYPVWPSAERDTIIKDLLYKVHNQLSGKLKTRFYKFCMEKKSVKQIAREENKTRNSIWVTLYLIRKKIEKFANN